MTSYDFSTLEEALSQLQGGVQCLMRMGDGMQDSRDGAALNFVADAMLKDVDVAQEWFRAAHTVARLSGPRAVSQ